MREIAMSGVKLIVGTATATVVMPEVAEIVSGVERVFLGIPQSMLFVSFAGTLIGVLLLSDDDADKVSHKDCGLSLWKLAWIRFLQWGMFALIIGSYALVNGWLVTFFGGVFGTPPSMQVPLVGLSGTLIHRMLPKYITAADVWIDSLIKRIGGKNAHGTK